MKKNIFLKLIILLIVILFTIPTYSNAAMTIDDIINGKDADQLMALYNQK